MGLAGIGFSSFGLGMLGGHRRGVRSFGIAEQAYADGLPDSQAKWLKEVGSTARRQIEALLGSRVYLDLRIKVAKDWQRDPRQLRRLGFYD